MGEQGSTSRSLMMELELGRDTTASTFPTAVASMSTIMPMTKPETALRSPMMELLHSLLLLWAMELLVMVLLDMELLDMELLDMVLWAMVLSGMLLPLLLLLPQWLLQLPILLAMVLVMSLVKKSRTNYIYLLCIYFLRINIETK